VSGAESHCRRADSVGAYVLGALPDAEARGFVRHLDDCRLCREDVTRLCAPVELLSAGAPPAVPSASLRRNVMATVQHEAADRRREGRTSRPSRVLPWALVAGRTTLAAAGAAAVAAVAVTVGIGASGPRRVAVSPQSHLAGQVAVLSPGGGGQFALTGQQGTLRVRGLPEPPHGRVYEVWLQRAGMAPQATDALFTTNERGEAEVGVPGSLAGVRRVLVTSEPRKGSVVPTRQPVIVVTL